MMKSPRSSLAFTVLTCIALLATPAVGDVSPEKMVGYAASPAVVMIKSEFIGDLINDDGEPTIYLQMENSTTEVPLEIPQFYAGGMGTGFIVSSDGYIVTNAHVVDMTEEELKADFALQATAWALLEFPPIFEENGEEAYPQTEEDVAEIYKEFLSYDVKVMPEIRVYFGSPEGASDQAGHPAEIRKISRQKMWVGSDDYKYRSGKDLAVIKIEGFSDLPTVKMGDSDEVEVGDRVIVIGYPGLATSWEHVVLSTETDYVPTVTSGIISARKKLPDGSWVFQTDAAIHHGNSGGPAFNDDGKVIGVVTFGSGKFLTSGDWVDVQGYDFLIPANVAKTFVNELNVDTAKSATTEHFERGLEHYWDENRTQAEEEFDKVLALVPGNAYAREYARMARVR